VLGCVRLRAGSGSSLVLRLGADGVVSRRRWSAAAVGLLCVVGGTVVVGSLAGTAAAATCTTSSGTTTCVFASTGAEQVFTVPGGVTSVHVEARGAAGATSVFGASGGRGALVTGDLPVTPGAVLYVEVGGAPTGSARCGAQVCEGGFNGGGSSQGNVAAGGGGASDVRTVPRTDPGTLASRLLVAAGGGGGGDRQLLLAFNCPGGAGGDAGTAGADGGSCGSPGVGGDVGGTGGGAGSASAGGAGGVPRGEVGSLGVGGSAGSGGCGGGGLFGGGGGGDNSIANDINGLIVGAGGGGGGGGGSSLVPAGGTAGLTSDPPQISVSYSDLVPPAVSVEQAVGQADPATAGPIHFTAVFSEPVSGFGDAAGDVLLSGTAGATSALVSEVAPNDGTTYDIAVSGMRTGGTVIAAVPAGAARDGSGNGNAASTSADNAVTFDSRAPETAIDSSPPDPSSSSSAVFGFGGSDDLTPAAGLRFECQLDGGGFSACASPQGYSGVADGSHSFEVRAIDGAGNVDATPAGFGWTIGPVAREDTYSTGQGTTLTVAAPGVLGNDAGPAALSAVVVNGPAHGTLSLSADGSFTYSPAAAYVGPDSFTYNANDGSAASSPATATIAVAAAPAATPPPAAPPQAAPAPAAAEPAAPSAPLPGVVLVADTLAPGAPMPLRARLLRTRLVGATLELFWPTATDNVGVDHYELERNGLSLERLPAAAVTTTIRLQGAATYTLIALDGAGNQSSPAIIAIGVRARPAAVRAGIPRWAWRLLVWRASPDHRTLPRPAAPTTLPAWYWRWAGWRLNPYRIST
jgi:hypothetical protein